MKDMIFVSRMPRGGSVRLRFRGIVRVVEEKTIRVSLFKRDGEEVIEVFDTALFKKSGISRNEQPFECLFVSTKGKPRRVLLRPLKEKKLTKALLRRTQIKYLRAMPPHFFGRT